MSFHVEYQMGMFGVKAPRDNRLKFISGYDAVQLMDAMRDSKIMFHALIRCDSIECMDSRKTFKPITSDMLRELFENNAMHHVMTESAAHAPGFSERRKSMMRTGNGKACVLSALKSVRMRIHGIILMKGQS